MYKKVELSIKEINPSENGDEKQVLLLPNFTQFHVMIYIVLYL